MNKPKKHSADKKPDIVQEPAMVYETEKESSSEDSEELHPILIQLIEKGKCEAALGLGIPHEEAMRRLKLKYPFLK